MSAPTLPTPPRAPCELTKAHRALLAIVDGGASTLTAEQAKALKAQLWDMANELGRTKAALSASRKRQGELTSQFNQYVDQAVSEEARASAAEARCAALEHALKAAMSGRGKWRDLATALLEEGER